MTPGRVLLIALVVLATIVFFAGVGLGLSRPRGGSLSPPWARSLGALLTTRAGPGDVTASSSACFSGSALTIGRGRSCDYSLGTGFLARRLVLKADSVAAGPLAPGVVVVLDQPGLIASTKTLGAPGGRVEFRYQKQGSTLAVSCQSLVDCRIEVDTG